MSLGAGPAAVRWLREASGLTQRDLAERSGVSVRTIRALENGQVSSPHQASLLALAEAAALDEQETELFLRAWMGDPGLPVSVALNSHQLDHVLAQARLRAEVEQRTHLAWTRVVVGAHRRIRHTQHRYVFEALRNDVRHHLALHKVDPSEDLRLLSLVEPVGCSPERRIELTEADVLAVELRYPRAMQRGEVYAIGFTFDGELRAATDAALAHLQSALPASDSMFRSARALVGTMVIEIVFEGSPPDRAWSCSGDSYHTMSRDAEVSLDTPERLAVVRRNVAPGFYGFAWSWPTKDDRLQ